MTTSTMTSNQTGPLYLFKNKIENAVNLVPSMNADDKLQAIIYWNLLSEKLQDIVNRSAADINNALEIQRENENIQDVFDSNAAQNEKELNDNLESLINEQNNNDLLKPDRQLMFDNQASQLLDSDSLNNLEDNMTSNLASISMTSGLPSSLATYLQSNNQLDNNLSNNLQASIDLTNELNNLAQPSDRTTQSYMNTSNNELDLEDISNFTTNLELAEQDMISETDQLKINSALPTMHKDLFNFDQFQRENVIRNGEPIKQSQSKCDLENLTDQNNILQAIATTSNDSSSAFISCNSNGCVDASHLNCDLTTAATNNLAATDDGNSYPMNRLNANPLDSQILLNQMIDQLQPNKNEPLRPLSDTRSNIRNNSLTDQSSHSHNNLSAVTSNSITHNSDSPLSNDIDDITLKK